MSLPSLLGGIRLQNSFFKAQADISVDFDLGNALRNSLISSS
jgi:hypothetical protein